MSAEREAAARAFYEDTGEHANGAFEAGWDGAILSLEPRQVIRVRGRQSGKTHEAAQFASRISGLTVETCEELARAGYTFAAYRDKPNEWVQNGRRR